MKCVLEVVCWWCVWSMQAVVLDGDPNAAQSAPLVPNGIPGVARVVDDPFSLRQPAGPASPSGPDIPGFQTGGGIAPEHLLSRCRTFSSGCTDLVRKAPSRRPKPGRKRGHSYCRCFQK